MSFLVLMSTQTSGHSNLEHPRRPDSHWLRCYLEFSFRHGDIEIVDVYNFVNVILNSVIIHSIVYIILAQTPESCSAVIELHPELQQKTKHPHNCIFSFLV